jgi:hypothetical protein
VAQDAGETAATAAAALAAPAAASRQPNFLTFLNITSGQSFCPHFLWVLFPICSFQLRNSNNSNTIALGAGREPMLITLLVAMAPATAATSLEKVHPEPVHHVAYSKPMHDLVLPTETWFQVYGSSGARTIVRTTPLACMDTAKCVACAGQDLNRFGVGRCALSAVVRFAEPSPVFERVRAYPNGVVERKRAGWSQEDMYVEGQFQAMTHDMVLRAFADQREFVLRHPGWKTR